MGYQHAFYGIDLARLQALFGCRDQAVEEELLTKQAEELASINALFEQEPGSDEMPTAENAVREILSGEVGEYTHAAAVFGYVLKVLCEHFGQPLGADVACVRDQPFSSQLVASGPPLPIPYDRSDFPEIGFLAVADIPAELARLDRAPRRAKRSFVVSLIHWLSGGVIGRQMSDEETIEDMDAYRATLQESLERRLSLVSFRH